MTIIVHNCELGICKDNTTLYAGFITNTGVSRTWEIEYDYDFSFDKNLQFLYDKILKEW